MRILQKKKKKRILNNTLGLESGGWLSLSDFVIASKKRALEKFGIEVW